MDEATGKFVLALEPGDVLPPHALAAMAARILIEEGIDVLYADEDVLEAGLRQTPRFKPEWSPEMLRSFDYFGRPTLLRRDAVVAAGSFAKNWTAQPLGICTCG